MPNDVFPCKGKMHASLISMPTSMSSFAGSKFLDCDQWIRLTKIKDLKKSKSMNRYFSRRKFLSLSATASFGFQFLPSRVWGANERINLAGIGVGGKGTADVQAPPRPELKSSPFATPTRIGVRKVSNPSPRPRSMRISERCWKVRRI